MIQNISGGGTMVTGSSMETYRLLALASAVKLEAAGLRVRHGFSATKMAQQVTGLRTRDRSKLEARLREMANELEAGLRACHERAERCGTRHATDVLCLARGKDEAVADGFLCLSDPCLVVAREGNDVDAVLHDDLALDDAPKQEWPDILVTYTTAFRKRLSHFLKEG